MSPDLTLLGSRLLIAFLFLGSGIGKIKGDQESRDAIAGLGFPAPGIVEKLTGLFLVLCSAALIFGVGTRIAGTLLAVFVFVVTPLLLRFWAVGDPAVSNKMKQGFVSNLAIIGGIAALVTAGPGAFALMPST